MPTPGRCSLSAELARRRVGLLIYPDCEFLDVCGPFEVFHFADLGLGILGRTKEPSYQSLVLAAAPGPIRALSGMEIVATHRYGEIADGLVTLVVVGGTGCEEASKDPALVEWVRSIAPKTRRVASVCSEAFILAAAGLLHNRRATTHWMYSDLLAKAYPSIEVDASLIFIRDGNIYTSGEITTGIDLALALVEEDVGTEVMLGVARALIVFPRRPGGQSQFKGYTSIPRYGRTSANFKPGCRRTESRLKRACLGGAHGDEPAQLFAALSPRDGTDSGAVRRTGTSRRGALQARTDPLADRVPSPRNAGSLIPAHPPHVSTPFRHQPSRLPGTISINPLNRIPR